ncbi:MATE family efflux transporter [Faecalibacillus faecis]|uniref:MATE family efflux transporter n=1 Tax=Faecalibacillus faecis TaxID=1982628 RepID=A0AAW4VLC3_9FIRM|nr:MATE family efflux transporter [Faecalibacillus faecis]MCB8567030.1 MATE family efflux transporter [Faecalibacillus faecis]MCB8609867.1 MATE family efflux transporter [Faecalibacillus faecis]MCQ5199329.1 MATE family efflux transporter [Faecalibacillus faecis]
MKGNTQDLTKGSIVKAIILFSVPLLIGNLFQQLYNAVDSYVVGNYVGKVALAAVGASTPIINMLIGFFMGISTGAGVVIAQFFGAGDLSKMKKAIHNSIALTLVIGVVLTVIGLVFNDPILKAIGVPNDVFSEASTYLSIYFWSLIFVMIYNMGSGILRSVGDSKRPLYFLIFSSIINIVLDFLFVKNFGFGVAGAGYATLIAQAISAIMVMYVLMKTEDSYKVVLKDIKFDKEILLKIIKIGLPTGFQQSIVSLSNVIVQSYINVYGASVIAGYSVTIKIDGFVNLPLQAFNMAITTFVGQNIGAKQYNRVKKGAYITTFLAMVTIGFFVVIMYFFGRDFIALFNQEKDVIDAGRLMQLTFLPFYIFLPINQVINGVLRGAGRSAVPMYVMIFSFVFLRQIYLFLVTKVTSDVVYVFLGWPTTWVVCSLIFIVYFFKVQWLPQEKGAEA